MEQVDLTSEQERAWDNARSAFLWSCPAFSAIFYNLMNNAGSKHIAYFTKDVPIAATDGSNLILNPETFFKLHLKEQVFVIAHEVAHAIFNHCVIGHGLKTRGKVSYPDGSTLPYDHGTMNIAMDLVINDMLVEAKVGQKVDNCYHDTSIATMNDSVIDAYKKVFDDQQKGGGKSGKGAGFDQHLAPGSSTGQDPHTAAGARNDAQWNASVAAALESERLRGTLPGAFQRLLKEITEPVVDWKDKIAAMMARKLGSGSYSWRRPDRALIVRDVYAPGRTGFGCDTVVIAVDTSGSIGEKELNMFFGEMSGILEDARPKNLYVIWCDAKVHRVDQVEDAADLPALRAKGAPGGGGTAFEPVFKEIEDMGLVPEALVYLTDGMGSFPARAPRYPVIWGNIYAGSKYPFGEVIDIPKQV